MIVINRQTWWHQALVIFEKILKNQFLFCIWIKLFFFLSKNDVFLQIFHFLRWKIWLKMRTKYFLRAIRQTWWHQALVIFEKILKNQFLFCIWIKLVFFFQMKWCFFANLVTSFIFEKILKNQFLFCIWIKLVFFCQKMICLRAILGIWLKIEDKILLDNCNHSPNLVTSSACYFWKNLEKSIFVLHLN